MRKRIQKLARGEFEYARPLLGFSTDKISIETLEGKDFAGDFVITSGNHVPMRGVVYASDPRMECLTPQFEGEEVRIRYQYHSGGLAEGDIQKGDFYVICNQGEYNLSFVVSILGLYADSSVGKIRTLSDFTMLAEKSFPEAVKLFYTAHFKNVIRGEKESERLLYEGFRHSACLERGVEEFLIASGRKKRIAITADQTRAEFESAGETRKETLLLRRENRGWFRILVTSDADFLEPDKKELTDEDFVGSQCVFSYYIRADRLHAGRNYGRLTFRTTSGAFSFEVTVISGESGTHEKERQRNAYRAELTRLYIDYRLKKIVTGVWANRTIEILDHLIAQGGSEELYTLMKAQAFLINRQRQEALWIMEDFKRNWIRRDEPIWGYYLYLCTLAERESTYVDRLTEEIETLFHKNPNSALLFWILLFVRDDYYRNGTRRLRAIESWVETHGCHSPYLYLEAYYLFWQDPYLLGRLDRFEIRILNWAAKQHVISKDLARQTVQLAAAKRDYDPFVYRILEECYRVEESDETLSAVCGYLIKGQRYETRYHRWYELGIEHELRITSLYEAYLLSLDGHAVDRVPKMIQMYFQYDSKIDYEKRAVLFVNIIAGKERQPEVWRKYQRIVEQFALEQLDLGHKNDNLAVLYEEVFSPDILNRELARKLAGVLFVHKLVCRDSRAARALIYDGMFAKPQIVVFSEQTAYFTACTDDYCVLLEDADGNRIAQPSEYTDQALMDPNRYIDKCLELAPECLEYAVYHFKNRRTAEDWETHDYVYFAVLMDAPEVSEAYKAALLPEIIRFCQRHVYDGTLSSETLENYQARVEKMALSTEARRRLIELFTEAHRYEKAYRMVRETGYENLGQAARVALCSYAITECGFEEDDFLLGFAAGTFAAGKYNDVMLIYLCQHYNGPTKRMSEVWRAAGEFEIDTFDLEERILMQMLYTGDYTPYAASIYESYCAGGGRELLCMAYLSDRAHGYLTKDAVVPEHVFRQIEERYLAGQELNDACLLGLLKYYSNREKLRDEQRRIADELLSRYTLQNLYFAFYRGFEKKIRGKYHLYDKFFVEYHTAPHRKVEICYRMEGETEYRTEKLTEMYDGIYVRQFILFFGETVQYYISEPEKNVAKMTESGCLQNHDVTDGSDQSRYAALNDILFLATMEDKDKLRRKMRDYYGMWQVTDEVFGLLR